MNSEGGTDAELRQRKREAHAQLKEKPSDEDDKEEQRRGGGEYCCLLHATTLLCLGTGRDAEPGWPRLGGGKAPTGGSKLRVTLHAIARHGAGPFKDGAVQAFADIGGRARRR